MYSDMAPLYNQTDANMLDKTGFNERLVRVLEQRVKEKKKKKEANNALTIGVAVALVAAIDSFFVLKGSTLAYFGHENFSTIMMPVSAGGGIAGLRYWLGGLDPVTEMIATVINPAH